MVPISALLLFDLSSPISLDGELANCSLHCRTDRNVEVGGYQDIEAWTKFDYYARNGKYSAFSWNKDHFSGVDYDDKNKTAGIIYRFEGKKWADADEERGNYDYLSELISPTLNLRTCPSRNE